MTLSKPPTSNDRLRSTATLSPHNTPSCMTVRTGNHTSTTPTLVAIAGPMGISILDVLTPQRPWLVLNYASIPDVNGVRGGIHTMAFQPGGSTTEEDSILLATARGAGILIWDCSGRALSPMLGRLNVSDAWSAINRKNQDGNETMLSQVRPTVETPDNRKNGASLSSSSSQATSAPVDTLLNNASSNHATVSNVASNSNHSSCDSKVVTSLAWKGPSTPILLATTGPTACLFDLRTSLFSSTDTTSGRPYARFTSPEHIVHCSYSHDESLHVFSTLDCSGVVRLWDDRMASSSKANLNSSDCALTSFEAYTQTGVGIASIPPESDGVNSRWVTWGLDEDNGANNDELIVKVWDSVVNKLEPNRAPTVSTVSVDEEEIDKSEVECLGGDSFYMTCSVGMKGGAAARVHPDGLLLFRSQFDSSHTSEFIIPSPLIAGGAQKDDIIMEDTDTRNKSPVRTKSSNIASPPATMSPSVTQMLTVEGKRRDEQYQINTKKGWKAQLLRLHSNTIEKFATIEGGGSDEDILCMAPGSVSNIEDILAVELAHSPKEPLLCCLSANSLRVYGLPELKPTVSNTAPAGLDSKKVSISHAPTSSVARVYNAGIPKASNSWWNQSEQDVFGDVPSTRVLPRVEDDSSLHASGRSLDRGSLPIAENITNLIASEKTSTSSLDEGDVMSIHTAIKESDANVVIDPNKAKCCPCPPFCGVAFGRGGKLVSFNNGPVKRMWAWYRESPTGLKPFHSYSEKPVVFSQVSPTTLDMDATNEKKTSEEGIKESEMPRTLFDLIEMTSKAKIAQWGVDLDNSANSNGPSSENNSSSCSDESSFDASSVDSQSEDSDGFHHVTPTGESFEGKFDYYFASSRKSLTNIGETGTSTTSQIREEKQFAGITSLSPSVFLTNSYNDILMNGQSAELAQLLELGDAWWLLSDFSSPDSWEKPISKDSSLDDKSHQHHVSEEMFARQISYESSRSVSMVGNMKKIITYQSPGSNIPPDQKIFKSKKHLLPTSDLSERQSLSFARSEKVPLGIYTKERHHTSKTTIQRFYTTRMICLRNAKIMEKMGMQSKADTWVLLAQAVQSVQAFQSDNFDGWGDALTTGLVEQIFQYYEAEGDYQMLATMVCVLTLGRDRRFPKAQSDMHLDKCMLLPQRSTKEQIHFDNYLHRYADLLYSWGILTVRSEISKRLAYPLQNVGGENTQGNQNIVIGSGFCRVCKVAVGLNRDVCKMCQNCAFQCSICCSAVRGASTFCPFCGHGGHLDHIISWFNSHKTCPTGCGCTCIAPKEENVPRLQ